MIIIDGNSLTIEQVVSAARNYEKLTLSQEAFAKINNSHQNLLDILEMDKPVYGINTGFGIFSDKIISSKEIEELNRNLILSHAVAVGEYFPDEIVRAAMLIRANTLAKGFSGVRVVIVENLLRMLNLNVVPRVRQQGSLGSSGDLCLLAQIALVLTKGEVDFDGESGEVLYEGKILSGKKGMNNAGIERIVCQPKEGLALINGATVTAALGSLAVHDAFCSIHAANLSLALCMEALRARTDFFDQRIHNLRGMDGQIFVARECQKHLKGSTFTNKNGNVQDAYSLRCAPQVHGAVYDAVKYAENVLLREINAVTDNPIIFDNKTVISGGNFHGEPLGFALDLLNIALGELGAISERRIARLLDTATNNGLPTMLVNPQKKSGLQSGLMILQYTAASLALENKTLSSPCSIHSLPTSANQEDHNANCTTAGRQCLKIIENIKVILSIEVLCAYHAIQILKSNDSYKNLGVKTKILAETIYSEIGYDFDDHNLSKDVEKVREILFKLCTSES